MPRKSSSATTTKGLIARAELDAGRVDLSDVVDAKARRLPAIHPGEILRDEFLDPLAITPYRLAKDIGVPQTRIAAILAGERAITAETALRFSRYFGISAQFWLGLQQHYDLRRASAALGNRLQHEVQQRVGKAFADRRPNRPARDVFKRLRKHHAERVKTGRNEKV